MLESLLSIAEIISWNIWQMDGLKFVIPKSCETKSEKDGAIFDIEIIEIKCEGCEKSDIHRHNGIYALIKDWESDNSKIGEKDVVIKFVSLIKNQ